VGQSLQAPPFVAPGPGFLALYSDVCTHDLHLGPLSTNWSISLWHRRATDRISSSIIQIVVASPAALDRLQLQPR